MSRIAITGARAPVALDLARAFRAAGHMVTLADSVRPFAAALARPAFAIHRLPPPRYAFAAFREATRLLATHHDLIVPTCEEIFWLAEAAHQDHWSDRLFAPSPAMLRGLHSKALFPALAREAGVAAPDTRPLSGPADLDAYRDEPKGFVFKPEFSRFGTATLIGPDWAQVAQLEPTHDHRWVAQERLEGEELCVWSAVRDGRVVAFAAYRPLLRHGRSAAYAFEAVERPALREVAERIAARVGGRCQLSYDVILAPDGRAAPVECNPRSVSGIHLFDSAPDLAWAILEGREVKPPIAGTIRYLAPAMALLGLFPALAGGWFARWRDIARQGADSVGRPGDRGPVAGVLLDAARFAWLGLKRHRSATGATTDDIEWNGEPIG